MIHHLQNDHYQQVHRRLADKEPQVYEPYVAMTLIAT